jgi:NADH dehydrogenase
LPTVVITGAFSNTGAAVAGELARRGWSVRTLTNRPPPATSSIPATPLRFDRDLLTRALSGADAFVNTYWVRFPHRGITFDTGVQNSRLLIEAARAALVSRFVQVSVCNASEGSTLAYFRGKASVERLLRESALSYGIVRPTLTVGPKDVMTNNIAWFLRRLPVFVLPAGHGYRLQPVMLDDVARIIADAVEHPGPLEVDAAGPEVVTFGDYVRRLALAMGIRRSFVAMPGSAVLAGLRVVGALLQDTVLTPEELAGLQQELLVSRSPALGKSSVFDWLAFHARDFGHVYSNDTKPRFAGSNVPQ